MDIEPCCRLGVTTGGACGLMHDRCPLEPVALRRHVRVDLFKQLFPQSVAFRQMLRSQYRLSRLQRATQPQSHKPPHRLQPVEHVLHPRIAQIIKQPHAMHSQHRPQWIRSPSSPHLRVILPDPTLRTFPRYQFFHLLRKDFLPRHSFLRITLQLPIRRLLGPFLPFLCASPCTIKNLFRLSRKRDRDTEVGRCRPYGGRASACRRQDGMTQYAVDACGGACTRGHPAHQGQPVDGFGPEAWRPPECGPDFARSKVTPCRTLPLFRPVGGCPSGAFWRRRGFLL